MTVFSGCVLLWEPRDDLIGLTLPGCRWEGLRECLKGEQEAYATRFRKAGIAVQAAVSSYVR